jgi:hypothetical protein
MQLTVIPKFPLIQCLVIEKETTAEEVLKFIRENTDQKILIVHRCLHLKEEPMCIEFSPTELAMLDNGSLLFSKDRKLHYVLAEDASIFWEFYERTNILPHKKKLKVVLKKKKPTVKTIEDTNNAEVRQYTCPCCNNIFDKPFDVCPNCGSNGESIAEPCTDLNVKANKIKEKNMAANIDFNKIREEAENESTTEVTAVYGDNVSVSNTGKSNEEAQEVKTTEGSNL